MRLKRFSIIMLTLTMVVLNGVAAWAVPGTINYQGYLTDDTGSPLSGEYIRFESSSSLNTRLFSIKGTSGEAMVAGIQIYNGGIRMYQNGCIKFHE